MATVEHGPPHPPALMQLGHCPGLSCKAGWGGDSWAGLAPRGREGVARTPPRGGGTTCELKLHNLSARLTVPSDFTYKTQTQR